MDGRAELGNDVGRGRRRGEIHPHPARPKEASAEIVARIDAEAELGLENIKRKVELRKR
jgi:hypothetical protein